MKIVCDACSAKYSIADEKVAGKVFKIRCKRCSTIIVVRGAADEAEAGPAPADDLPEDAIWHLVIDQSQVGPMTPEDVGARVQSGEADGQTYVWCEGFGDWERLADVQQFAHLFSGAADSGDLFAAHQPMAGGGAGDEFGNAPTTVSQSPAMAAADEPAALSDNLFAAPAAASDGGGGSADMGFAAAGGGGVVGGAAESVPSGAQMKGQRNDNSVLFSLNNLAALAGEAPEPAAAEPAGNAARTEGSGLIDIRSMAQVYLSDQQSNAAPAGDLPVFNQGSFEQAAPVFLPPAEQGKSKLVYALMAMIGLLVAVGGFLIFMLLQSDNGRDAVASNDPNRVALEAPVDTGAMATGAVNSGPPANTPPAGETKEPVKEPPKVAAVTPEDSNPPAADEPKGETKEPEKMAAPTSAPATRDDRKRKERERERERERKRKEREREKKLASVSRDIPKPDPKPRSTSSSCDEVTCLVDPDKACCKKYRKSDKGDSGSSSSASSDLPERLSRGDITAGIGRVRGAVRRCSTKTGFTGRVDVRIKIGGNGRVKSVNASGGSPAVRSCVGGAVKRARFKKTQKGLTVNYPFIL